MKGVADMLNTVFTCWGIHLEPVPLPVVSLHGSTRVEFLWPRFDGHRFYSLHPSVVIITRRFM